MRANRSRPSSSVPSRCSAEGSCRRSLTAVSFGSKPLNGPASSDTATTQARAIAAPSTIRRRNSLRSTSGTPSGRRGTGFSGPLTAPAWGGRDCWSLRGAVTSVLHPWIDHRVQEVDGEVDDHVDYRHHQQRALDHRVVAPDHRTDHQVADAG